MFLRAHGLCLGLVAILTGCLPPEIDTPPLNAKQLADEANGTAGCVPGKYGYGVAQSTAMPVPYQGQCDVPSVMVTTDPEKLRLIRHIKHVEFSVDLAGNVDLATAMPDLESCGTISAYNFSGAKLTSPPKLTQVGTIQVGGPQLLTVSGFDNVTALKKLAITNSPNLTTISGFAKLAALDELDLSKNPKLTQANIFGNVAALNSLKIVAEVVHVPNTPGVTFLTALPEVPPFPKLTTVTGALTLGNLTVPQVQFAALQAVGTLSLTGMLKLTALDFGQLSQVQALTLDDVPALPTLTGLPKVVVTQAVKLCVAAVPCADVAAFGVQHAPAVPQGQWTTCVAGMACKP